MKYNDIRESVLAQFAVPNGNRVVPFIVGKPGGGKSSVARDVAKALAEVHGISKDRIVEFNPSLREPTDIMGVPRTDGDYTRWVPPAEMFALRKGVGPAVLIIEELSDATMDMQNPMCRLILDRCAGQMELTDELFIIATGNRTEDRSGASRLSTKLANRLRIIEFESTLDDWLEWAEAHDVAETVRLFLKWRPALLHDFDPARPCNPTPRAWEDVSRIPLDAFSDGVLFEHVAGSVGEGAASEYVGFLKILDDLPDLDKLLKNPDKSEIPENPAVLFAVTQKLSSMATEKNFPKMYKFIKRLPPEFQTKTVSEAVKHCRAICRTKEYMDFSSANLEVLFG